MTIVVNAFASAGLPDCPWVMVHATDRLVSLRYPTRLEPKYPAFNKSIIYRASDAIVTIGFTGIAFLEGMPTEEWIASILAGVEFDPFMGVALGQNYAALNLGQAVHRLETELNAMYAREKLGENLSVFVAGARWKRSRWRRVVVSLERTGEGRVFQAHQCRWETRQQWRNRLFIGPAGNVPSDDAQQYAERLSRSRSITDIERVVDQVVTKAAERHPTIVGRDVTAVRLWPSTWPRIEIMYLHRSSTDTFEGFTPWMLGPRSVMAPAAVSAPIGMMLDGVAIQWRPVGLCDAPTGREPPVTPGWVFSFRGHPDREHF